MNKPKKTQKKKQSNLRVGLTKKQVCFLDKLITNIRFSSGKKFTRSQVVKALFHGTKNFGIKIRGIKSEKELTKQFLAAYRKRN